VTVFVAGEKLMEISGFVRDGRTYVPFRDIFSALSLEISYDAKTKETTGKRNDLTISFKSGERSVTINGVKQTADPAIVESGVTYVPANYVSKQGTGLTINKKHANGSDLIIEGNTIGETRISPVHIYKGDGTLKGEKFIPNGNGKIYNNDGSVYVEPYTKDGSTGSFKDGKQQGWFKCYLKDLGYGESYLIFTSKNNENIGVGYYYNSNDELLYTMDYDDGGKITVYKK
ncbi:copper amine oxidase N-terminal domain-containing protein, partial [Paenibacillus alvei]|uniref:copper amine oxidase N-terminal domain-containing protein n=1 Tax=Paenibacillus alvei TaxID=44250 RepID=UPI00228509F5